MKAFIDLHIHSSLSPCANEDMTPNNILNMAALKELDMIAITDHNSVENLEAFYECSKTKSVRVVPGIEIESKEEVHVICLFKSIHDALLMQKAVYQALPTIPLNTSYFGKQTLINSMDEVIGEKDSLLSCASTLSVSEIANRVIQLGGVMIPAHVDRPSYSILSNLGFIPDHLRISYLEVSKKTNIDLYRDLHPELSKYSFIRSSDAHYLGDILERESWIELQEISPECLIDVLSK